VCVCVRVCVLKRRCRSGVSAISCKDVSSHVLNEGGSQYTGFMSNNDWSTVRALDVAYCYHCSVARLSVCVCSSRT